MKILHLSGRSAIGGGPAMIYSLIAATRRLHDHSVACPPGGLWFTRLRELLGARNVRPLNPLALRWRSFDLIHTHGFGAGLCGRIAARMSGTPCLHTFHGFHPRTFAHGKIEAGLARWTQHGVAVSTTESEQILARLPDFIGKLSVIPNGVAPLPRTEGDSRRVIWAGRLVAQKHPEAVAAIAKLCPGLTIRMFGGGPLRPRLSPAMLAGESEDIPRQLATAGIFLSTARWEGLPLALLEAMHAGLACVVTNVQGNRDAITHGETGFLYDPRDPSEAAAYLNVLASEPQLRRSIGDRAREHARREFSIESMAERYMEAYENCHRP